MIIDVGDIERGPDGRASFEDTFMAMARVLAELRGDCTRKKVAAIIFNPANGDIVQAGYNGAPSGATGCLQGGCPRGRHYKAGEYYRVGEYRERQAYYCACGREWPCPDAVAPGTSYDTGPGCCIAIHAELNACLRAGLAARGMTMVVTEEPCDGCVKILRGARLARVVTPSSEFTWGLPCRHEHLG